MNITVIKETDQTYLSLDGFDPQEYGYAVNMAQNCPLESLLPIHIFFCDGKSLVRYRITGFTSLSERFSDSPLRLSDIRNILYTLRDICQRLPEYLLASEDLLLDPEKLFIRPGSSKIHVAISRVSQPYFPPAGCCLRISSETYRPCGPGRLRPGIPVL